MQESEETALKNLLKEISQNVNIKYAVDLKDNIFTILDKERDERTHCRVLRYLISEYWSDFRDICLKKLNIDGRQLLYSECEYACAPIQNCEHFTDSDGMLREKRGSIDILLILDGGENKTYVPLEVKLDAEDQSLQLVRYYEYLKTCGGDVKPVYLTLNGKKPSQKSINCSTKSKCKSFCNGKCSGGLSDKDYYTLSFCDGENSIKSWLGKIIKDSLSGQKSIAEQYYDILDLECRKMKAENILLDNKDNFEAARTVFESCYLNAVSAIQNKFFGKLSNYLQDLGCTLIEIDDNLKAKLSDNNAKLVGEKDGKVFSVCVATNLYCRKKGDLSDEKYKLDKWCYIDIDWFEKIVQSFQESEKGSHGKVDFNRMYGENNKIVDWYFKDEKSQDVAIKSIAVNLLNYLNI